MNENEMNLSLVTAAVCEDIGNLYASATQYRNHAALLQGVHTQMAANLIEHANDDLEQAAELTEKVAFYGYNPIPAKVDPVLFENSADDMSLDMLMSDLSTISRAVIRFKKHLALIREAGVSGLELIYLEIIRHEEEHLNTFQSYLTPYLAELAEQGEDMTCTIMTKRAASLRMR